MPSTNLWYQTFANGGSTQAFTDTFTPASANAPALPGHLQLPARRRLPLAVPPSPRLRPDYRTPYTINTSVQVSRQLTKNDALTVGYVHTDARELSFMRDLNLINPTSYLADGRPVFSSAINATTRLYPQFNGIKPAGHRRQHELQRHGDALRAPLVRAASRPAPPTRGRTR